MLTYTNTLYLILLVCKKGIGGFKVGKQMI
jgi:hypothetical protein